MTDVEEDEVKVDPNQEAISTVIVYDDEEEQEVTETCTSSASSTSAGSTNNMEHVERVGESSLEVDKKPSIIPVKNVHAALEPEAEKDEDLEFDPDSLIYMANACCELLHYRSAAVVVAVLEIVIMAVWLVFCVLFYKAVGLTLIGHIAISGQAIVAAIMIGAIGLTFAGVRMEKPSFLWPHMIIQIIGISIGIILTVIAVISMAAGTHIAEAVFGVLFGTENLPKVEQALGPIWPFCLAVIFDFGAAIGIWFYILIRGCYDYLLDKQFFETVANSCIQMDCKKSTPTVDVNEDTKEINT